MANKTLFSSRISRRLRRADVINKAGGLAYGMSPQHALAQYAATGCLNGTFYASGEEQLDQVLQLCQGVSSEFIARTALYARSKGCMKDMPALLLAVLSTKSPVLLAKVFDRVIDSPKMLRNFVQIMRSGVVGRKSLGSAPKGLVLRWLESRSDEQLFTGSIGNDPSLADIVKMVHPKPSSPARQALYGYLIGREYDRAALPALVQHYERIKRQIVRGREPVPDVPFQMLTSLPLTQRDWRQIARNASWQTTRMNLNTFQRHQVFADRELIGLVANRLRNPRLIEQARVFPYQLMVAYLNASSEIPVEIREALQDAMEIAISNVPHVKGKVYVCPDVSGSMQSPVTGNRPGATTKVRCLDVAALVAAAVLRRNPTAEVIPFESTVVNCRLNPRDTVLTNAQKLASLPCGGTNCSAPLAYLNQRQACGDLVIYVSDNESWVETPYYGRFGGGATATMQEWGAFQQRSPHAKMICIDIQPNTTTQAAERSDLVNVGGFSDQVFQLIADVAQGRAADNHWVGEIERMPI